MSNEKKIIKEMVQGNLKVNRKRNLLLVLAITLTTILFTSVLEIGFGGMQSIQETQLRLLLYVCHSHKATVRLQDIYTEYSQICSC